MQDYPFWVFDASGFAGNIMFSVLDPVLGFSSCTTPEWTVETKDIQHGNWEYKARAVKSADVSSITMTRGARFYDSDFYNWITNAIRGQQPVRRNLVLVHFLPYRPASQLLVARGRSAEGISASEDVAVTSLATRLPGRAWMLYDCLPTRYKPGSDFDATSSNVSVSELTVQPEHAIEMTVATVSPVAGRAVSTGLAVASAVA